MALLNEIYRPLPHSINQLQETPPHQRRKHYALKIFQTTLFSPFTRTARLAFRTAKLLTWDPLKAVGLKVLGHYEEATSSLERKYLNTVRAFRDVMILHSALWSAYDDLFSQASLFVDDLKAKKGKYFTTKHDKYLDQYYSDKHGNRSFEVFQPKGIHEFAADTDGSLNTVVASHFLKPGVLAINFGIPNVASFITEEKDGEVQTVKVDAKSLSREKMTFHGTNGKIQSGIFLIFTNLPQEALERFKESAQGLQDRADLTCVNTNCRVLKDAGFSIEALDLDKVTWPIDMFEHFLFRNILYTDRDGVAHKVRFDIVNTTQQNLEEHFDKVDLAVIATRLRHNKRNADTEENRKMRSAEGKEIRRLEKANLHLHQIPTEEELSDGLFRRISISVPSWVGKKIGAILGKHTIYEIDVSDQKEKIEDAFRGQPRLAPFPQVQPSLMTRIKKNLFFSESMINLIRRHIMGYSDHLDVTTHDLFEHLKSTGGKRLNYVILDDKIVLAKINVNGNRKESYRKAADWALSKHAVLSGRKPVYCSGELWYENRLFWINNNSGTYMPNEEQVQIAARLANEIFDSGLGGARFQVAE